MPTTVRVPAAFTGLFDQAEAYVRAHFDQLERNPEEGTIRIGNQRYVLIRAASLSTGVLEVMRDLIGEEEAHKFWYRMARVIGREDSQAFCASRGLTEGPARLSTGPVHFAFTGWARVEIDDRSRPVSDETYYLEYTHPNTFESESWARSGNVSPRPVCVFSAGYSAGWCSEAFGMELDAREVRCTAAGQGECRFVMSAWDRLDGYAAAIAARDAGASPHR
jgi:predicted hydrocarbon binding protein